jgi:hypothetical protein
MKQVRQHFDEAEAIFLSDTLNGVTGGYTTERLMKKRTRRRRRRM